MKFSVESAKDLYDAVSKCQKVCAKDLTRPVLAMIEMVVNEDDILIITALDGFQAVQKHIEVTCQEVGTCVVDPQLLMDAIGKKKESVSFETEGNSLICIRAGSTSAVQLFSEEYIRHAEIWPSPKQTYDIYFNIDYLINTSKSLKEDNDNIVHMQFDATTNVAPMSLLLKSGSRALVLPIRHNDRK